jgi:hypothetical protein
MKQFVLHPMQWRRISVPSKRDFLPWWVKRNCPALKAKPSNEELTILRRRLPEKPLVKGAVNHRIS